MVIKAIMKNGFYCTFFAKAIEKLSTFIFESNLAFYYYTTRLRLRLAKHIYI